MTGLAFITIKTQDLAPSLWWFKMGLYIGRQVRIFPHVKILMIIPIHNYLNIENWQSYCIFNKTIHHPNAGPSHVPPTDSIVSIVKQLMLHITNILSSLLRLEKVDEMRKNRTNTCQLLTIEE